MKTLLLLLLTTPPIIRRADRPDSLYLAVGARYPAVVALGRLGDGTLIAPEWILTAGHVGDAIRRGGRVTSVMVGGGEYQIATTVVHPDWREMGPNDIALVRLARPVTGVAPIPVYRRSDERGRVATLVGHGAAGTGTDRMRTEDGLARGATSMVDSADARWLYFSFDAPPGGTDLEGAPGRGDSGGPALIEVSDAAGHTTYVAGVSSAGYDGDGGPGSYGAVDAFTRVSGLASWIEGVTRGNGGRVRR